MVQPLSTHFDAARRLLGQEGTSDGDAAQRAAAAGRSYEKLFLALAPVIGAAGVRAVFARSVKVTAADFPALGGIGTSAAAPGDAHVPLLVACLSKLEPEAAGQVATALYATFFALLTSFIGERLVWQLVKSTFPASGETEPKETT